MDALHFLRLRKEREVENLVKSVLPLVTQSLFRFAEPDNIMRDTLSLSLTSSRIYPHVFAGLTQRLSRFLLIFKMAELEPGPNTYMDPCTTRSDQLYWAP